MTAWIEDIATLEACYGTPGVPSLVKVADRLAEEYRAWLRSTARHHAR